MTAYWHGTTIDLQVGDRLLPPAKTGVLSEQGRKKNLDRVFITNDFGSAKVYAGRAANSYGGTPVIYRVHPNETPTVLNANAGTTVLHTSGARVLERHPA